VPISPGPLGRARPAWFDKARMAAQLPRAFPRSTREMPDTDCAGLPPSSLGLEALLDQPATNKFGMIALNLDHPLLYRSATAAAGLQLLRQRFQGFRLQRQAADGGHCLAPAPLRFPTNARDPVTRGCHRYRAGAGCNRLATSGASTPSFSGIDQTAKRGHAFGWFHHDFSVGLMVDQQVAGHSKRALTRRHSPITKAPALVTNQGRSARWYVAMECVDRSSAQLPLLPAASRWGRPIRS